LHDNRGLILKRSQEGSAEGGMKKETHTTQESPIYQDKENHIDNYPVNV
jgi:hypothetical protein